MTAKHPYDPITSSSVATIVLAIQRTGGTASALELKRETGLDASFICKSCARLSRFGILERHELTDRAERAQRGCAFSPWNLTAKGQSLATWLDACPLIWMEEVGA